VVRVEARRFSYHVAASLTVGRRCRRVRGSNRSRIEGYAAQRGCESDSDEVGRRLGREDGGAYSFDSHSSPSHWARGPHDPSRPRACATPPSPLSARLIHPPPRRRFTWVYDPAGGAHRVPVAVCNGRLLAGVSVAPPCLTRLFTNACQSFDGILLHLAIEIYSSPISAFSFYFSSCTAFSVLPPLLIAIHLPL
jgi:hypothetical protein